MANRFTNYRPTEFVQTYDPYPFEEMYKMAQYKQGRADQANILAGKLAGEAGLEGGYLTGDLARNITKERDADINRLTQIAQQGNLGQALREYSKTQQQWKTDPRVATVNSDKALMPTIASNMAKPEFGNTLMYKAYDPTTGQFNVDNLDQLAGSGRAITPQDYGMMQNPGAEAAWGKTIDIVKPDILKNLVKNEDGTYSSAVADMDMNTILSKASGVLSNISSDGVNIDNPEALTPDAQQYIQYMQEAYRRDGKTYDYNAALEDFKDQAALRLQIRRDYKNADPTDSDSSKKAKEVSELLGADLGPTTLIDASDATMTEIGDKGYKKLVEATGFDYFTLKDKDGISAFDYVASDYVSNPSLTEAQNQTLKDEHTAKRRELDTQQYNNAYEQMLGKVRTENAPETVTVGGQTIVQSKKSPKAIEQEAHDKTMSILEKRRLAGVVAMKTAVEVGESGLPKFDKDGNIEGLSIDAQEAINSWKPYRTVSKGLSLVSEAAPAPKGFVKINEFTEDVSIVPEKYGKYFTALDKNTKETFGNRSFVAKQYALYSKGGELGATDIPVNQKMIVNNAITLAKLPESNVFYNGKKINAINTKDSSIDGHSMDKLYLSATADGKQETGDFTKGKGTIEFNPVSIYWNPNVNKWLTRGTYTRTGAEGENDLESAIYEVDVTPTMSSILTGDQVLQNAMQDAVHDALLSIPKGTSGVANVGMSNEQLKEFGNIHVIHNADDTYEITGLIIGDDGKKTSISKVIRDKHDRDPSSLDESFAKEVVFGGWLNQNKYSASNTKEIKSEDHGLMQINDATWKSESARDAVSTAGGTQWKDIPFETIAKDPFMNIRFSADIVRNTQNGWKNWSTYNDALKGEPNSIWERTIENVKSQGGWFALQNDPKYSTLIQELNNSYGQSNMTNIGKPNAFGLNDAQMAFVIMMAESGGNPNAVGQNFKK